jgi:UDP-glucose 4-epimerase
MKGKAVVTGGAGFIGSHLVRALIAEGYDVHIVDTFVGGRFPERHSPEATYHEIDIRDVPALVPVFTDAAYVFHLAALPRVQDSIEDPHGTHDVNLRGTCAVLTAARDAGVGRVILSASSAAYGDHDVFPLSEDLPARPKSPYALHKYGSERYCKLFSEIYGLPTVSLRYFNVYGPHADPKGPYALVIGQFIEKRAKGEPLTVVGDGTNTRDYVHVADVARANILAATSSSLGNGEVINIGSGRETSVLDLANLIGGEIMFAAPRIEPARSVADIRRAREVLRWEPTISLEEGVDELKREAGLE